MRRLQEQFPRLCPGVLVRLHLLNWFCISRTLLTIQQSTALDAYLFYVRYEGKHLKIAAFLQREEGKGDRNLPFPGTYEVL